MWIIIVIVLIGLFVLSTSFGSNNSSNNHGCGFGYKITPSGHKCGKCGSGDFYGTNNHDYDCTFTWTCNKCGNQWER